jgi:hypothetical protein
MSKREDKSVARSLRRRICTLSGIYEVVATELLGGRRKRAAVSAAGGKDKLETSCAAT